MRTRARQLNHDARNAANVLFLVAGLMRRSLPVHDAETADTVEDAARKLMAIVDELCVAQPGGTMKRMSTFDKVLHVVGLAAGGIAAVAATGGIALPGWLIAVAAVIAPIASGSASTWRKTAPSDTPIPDAQKKPGVL